MVCKLRRIAATTSERQNDPAIVWPYPGIAERARAHGRCGVLDVSVYRSAPRFTEPFHPRAFGSFPGSLTAHS